jgi:hypothetical protein
MSSKFWNRIGTKHGTRSGQFLEAQTLHISSGQPFESRVLMSEDVEVKASVIREIDLWLLNSRGWKTTHTTEISLIC